MDNVQNMAFYGVNVAKTGMILKIMSCTQCCENWHDSCKTWHDYQFCAKLDMIIFSILTYFSTRPMYFFSSPFNLFECWRFHPLQKPIMFFRPDDRPDDCRPMWRLTRRLFFLFFFPFPLFFVQKLLSFFANFLIKKYFKKYIDYCKKINIKVNLIFFTNTTFPTN